MNASAPYDQRLARHLVKPLAKIGVSPNQITSASLGLTFVAAWLFAQGGSPAIHYAAGLFVLGRFLDHFDGELARLSGKTSRFGYYYDYVAGALSYAALFVGIAIGQANHELGAAAWVLGIAGAAASLISLVLNMDLDRVSELEAGDAIGYPVLGGFELEDGIYLLAPITWCGLLPAFFVAAGIGACIYCAWTAVRLIRLKRR
ncbi:MAG: CDP-alcohol phosphatidyltransferase family protein [Gammaproteobacteria bacterium]|nr:CDP-alcohol phosphatidyltransferase family protein [Gammaproteobacteria bacterium]